ncbi:hypothetical protein CHARACLAT_022402 [Characodon lateralis]|uniref:Uncharacterized protein n=1 Tax=Characodon lateralis TaxID=208331 RepID=A0ABU7ECL1_9TELE|nr:hypothetical protein [Characodon lateralis]
MLFNAFHSDSEYIGTYLTCIWGSLWTDGQSKGQPRDMQDKQPCTHTHTSAQLRETIKPNSHVFAQYEEARTPRQNPCMLLGEHADSMQKDPRRGFEPRTFLLPEMSLLQNKALHFYI